MGGGGIKVAGLRSYESLVVMCFGEGGFKGGEFRWQSVVNCFVD